MSKSQIEDLIRCGALFVINHSAGKDSQAMAILVRDLVPDDQILVVHADLGEVEWPGNVEHIRETTAGLHLEVCRKGDEIKEALERMSKCELCTKDISESDKRSFTYDGGPVCSDCTPTYQDILDRPDLLIDGQTEDHFTPEDAKALCDSHVASGGSLTDKVGLV